MNKINLYLFTLSTKYIFFNLLIISIFIFFLNLIELSRILGSNENIKDVAIVGKEDNKWGEIVCAFVVLEDGIKLFEEDLIKWAKARLARYKCPKKVFFIKDNDMPRNATGKILHKELRKMVRNTND